MLIDVQAELDRVQGMTEGQAAAWSLEFQQRIAEAHKAEWHKMVVDLPTLRGPEPAVMHLDQWEALHADALALAPATGRHDARDSVRSAAVAGQLSHRTDRAARRGLRGRGMRG